MKKFLLLLCMLITYSLSFAQVEKGKWFAAGYSSLRLDIGKEKYSSGGTTSDSYKYTEFDFDPMAGYFVIDKLPVGLYFDVSANKHVDSDDGDTWKEHEFVVGPFARYYIKQFDKFIPYAEARIGIGTWKEDWYGDTEKESIFSYRFGAGASYFFTENVAFDTFLGYDYDRYTSVDNSEEYIYFYPSVEINFGIVVTFGKQ
jgi:opacity protein-like surface antigen